MYVTQYNLPLSLRNIIFQVFYKFIAESDDDDYLSEGGDSDQDLAYVLQLTCSSQMSTSWRMKSLKKGQSGSLRWKLLRVSESWSV